MRSLSAQAADLIELSIGADLNLRFLGFVLKPNFCFYRIFYFSIFLRFAVNDDRPFFARFRPFFGSPIRER